MDHDPAEGGRVGHDFPSFGPPEGESRIATTLNVWFSERDADWARRTRLKRYGAGELTLRDDLPLQATGCILTDGTMAEAECLIPGRTASLDSERVWTRRVPGTAVRRRGRLAIEPGTALRFFGELAADAASCSGHEVEPSWPELQRDLGASAGIRVLVRSELSATHLYAALCNTKWRHAATGAQWSCSWRSAGGIVDMLRAEGDYLDWYCSMEEGLVDEQVLAEIQALGWDLVNAEPPWG